MAYAPNVTLYTNPYCLYRQSRDKNRKIKTSVYVTPIRIVYSVMFGAYAINSSYSKDTSCKSLLALKIKNNVCF